MLSASVVPVITLWEEYLQLHKAGDIRAFAKWILKEKPGKHSGELVKQQPSTKKGNKNPASELTESGKALLLINRLHRYMQMNSKPFLKKIGFAKDHEYGVLIQVYLLKNPNKKEVAGELLLENSTAVEIIKRLVKRGLLKELADQNDKRASRLSLTEKGKQKLYESYEGMQKLHDNFLDCLSDAEKKELVKLLEQVEQFHMSNTDD